MNTRSSGHSLRTRLLAFLLLAVLLTVGVQATIAYRTARAEADAIFDYQMQQTALALRAGVPLFGFQATPDDAQDDENFNFIVQVWSADGRRVFQSGTSAVLPQRAVLGFSDVRSDVQAHRATYRVFTLHTRALVIQVAQDMAIRREMASALALRTVWPVALMAPLLMGVVGWVVNASLAPVARVRRQVAQRQADDLDPVSEAGLPDEVAPLVHELNLLFGRLREAFEAQNNFVADAAHELRSPLAALKLQVQGLDRAADAPARDLAVARLTAGIDRATRLVEQLLVLARQQASAAALARPEPVDLAAIARLAVAEIAAVAQARGIDVGLVHADEDRIDGHAQALQILLRNLLDNAVKYTPPGGTVDVAVRRHADASDASDAATLTLSVEDSGPGIPQDERERVLDRFRRGAAGTGAATGSGLGLAIVRSIAAVHGAQLVLDRSQRLGGLRVLVRFGMSGPALRTT